MKPAMNRQKESGAVGAAPLFVRQKTPFFDEEENSRSIAEGCALFGRREGSASAEPQGISERAELARK